MKLSMQDAAKQIAFALNKTAKEIEAIASQVTEKSSDWAETSPGLESALVPTVPRAPPARPVAPVLTPAPVVAAKASAAPPRTLTVNATIADFHGLLSRGLNTLEPGKYPWATELSDLLFLQLHSPRLLEITFKLTP